LEVEHPAAKILVELAQLQDQEVWLSQLFLARRFFIFHFLGGRRHNLGRHHRGGIAEGGGRASEAENTPDECDQWIPSGVQGSCAVYAGLVLCISVRFEPKFILLQGQFGFFCGRAGPRKHCAGG
jgi:hypothetical protein